MMATNRFAVIAFALVMIAQPLVAQEPRKDPSTQEQTEFAPGVVTVIPPDANPEETVRIQRGGGQVFPPRGPMDSSRVVYREKDARGIMVQLALAMSRSLGDKGGKVNDMIILVVGVFK